jgi:hypothetical protein
MDYASDGDLFSQIIHSCRYLGDEGCRGRWGGGCGATRYHAIIGRVRRRFREWTAACERLIVDVERRGDHEAGADWENRSLCAGKVVGLRSDGQCEIEAGREDSAGVDM